MIISGWPIFCTGYFTIIKTVFMKCVRIWEKVYNMLSQKIMYQEQTFYVSIVKKAGNVSFNGSFYRSLL